MFTERLSAESKNSYKGSYAESQASLRYHSSFKSIPLLISPRLFRRKNLGQVDIAIVNFNQVNIIEVKSSYTGIKASSLQKKRLYQSAHFLSLLFQRNTGVSFYSSKREKVGNCILS